MEQFLFIYSAMHWAVATWGSFLLNFYIFVTAFWNFFAGFYLDRPIMGTVEGSLWNSPFTLMGISLV